MGQFVILILALCLSSLDGQLEEAHRLYQEGEIAAEDTEAMQAFNRALEIYRSLALRHTSSALYANIGSCYYQLNEIAWAILYYERAHSLAPRDSHICQQLQRVRQAAGVASCPQATPTLARWLGSDWLSVSERVWAALISGALMAIFGSLAIWQSRRVYMQMAIGWATVAAVMLGSVVMLGLCLPSTAIVLRGAFVRVDGGMHYAAINDTPLLAGSRVVVKGTGADGGWTLVATGEGSCGYVPTENLGIR